MKISSNNRSQHTYRCTVVGIVVGRGVDGGKDEEARIDTLQIPEGRSRGWVEGAITSGHPSVLHLPLTTFRANKSWFLFPPPPPYGSSALTRTPHTTRPRIHSAAWPSLSVSRPSISPLYLFSCLPPHQPAYQPFLSLSLSLFLFVSDDSCQSIRKIFVSYEIGILVACHR